jgi:hypothetical protein
VTRFDSTDLDRLFEQLRADLPDEGFSARLHAALLAESLPEVTGRWRGWGKRVGTGVALAAIPLAAAAATLSGWTPPWTRTAETEPRQAEAPTSVPRSPARAGLASGSVASDAQAVTEVEIAPGAATASRVSRPGPELARPPAPVAIETDEPVSVPEPKTEQDAETPVAPRIERVRLSAIESDEPSEPGTGTSLDQSPHTSPASTTETQLRTNRTGVAGRSEREVARERRQRDALPERERRQLGPRVAR